MNTNWAGNLKYSAKEVLEPTSVEEVRELVARNPSVKALGTRHSFNRIADTDGVQISTRNLQGIGPIDQERRLVAIQSGVRFGELSQFLHSKGYSLANYASLPHISVAGATATATHGSGQDNPSLASLIDSLDLVTANGELRHISTSDSEFAGVVVSLGALGIVTSLTVKVTPAYDVAQTVYLGLPASEGAEHLTEILASAYSVSLFSTWKEDLIDQIWFKSIADGSSPDTLFGAKPAKTALHPISELTAENCTTQLGQRGPAYERLPHFRMGFTPSSGEELQSEYLIPKENAVKAFCKIRSLRGIIAPALQVAEIRAIAQDEFWISPFYLQPSVAFHFTWTTDWPLVKSILMVLERELLPLGAKPHWAKLSLVPPHLIRTSFPKFSDFQSLMRELDPEGKFRNPWLTELFA